jgi:arsenate reductase
MAKLNVLFLCTGNSCRSQMAEGWAHHLKHETIEPYSAGIEPHGTNEFAIRVMKEAGVNTSRQHSKHLDELKSIEFDYVITVCDNAHESCPIFPGKTQVIHVGFDDPPRLAKNVTSETAALEIYRRVRDEIRDYILTLPAALTAKQ